MRLSIFTILFFLCLTISAQDYNHIDSVFYVPLDIYFKDYKKTKDKFRTENLTKLVLNNLNVLIKQFNLQEEDKSIDQIVIEYNASGATRTVYFNGSILKDEKELDARLKKSMYSRRKFFSFGSYTIRVIHGTSHILTK